VFNIEVVNIKRRLCNGGGPLIPTKKGYNQDEEVVHSSRVSFEEAVKHFH
jgi:hypothetical protein